MAGVICIDYGPVLSNHYPDYELTGVGKQLSCVFPISPLSMREKFFYINSLLSFLAVRELRLSFLPKFFLLIFFPVFLFSSFFNFFHDFYLGLRFLVADMGLYTLPCQLVGPSVHR